MVRNLIRYPQLSNPQDLLSMWSELIRVLVQRDNIPSELTDNFGNIVQNSSVTYQTTPSDGVVIHDTTAGVITQYLPLAGKAKNRVLTSRNFTGVNNVVLQPASGESIDNAGSLSITSGNKATIRSDGFNWWVI